MQVEKSRPFAQQKTEIKAFGEKALYKGPTGTSRAVLEKNILEFEQSAQRTLHKMDVMLMTISSISNEKDPTKRLEVCTIYTYLSKLIYK